MPAIREDPTGAGDAGLSSLRDGAPHGDGAWVCYAHRSGNARPGSGHGDLISSVENGAPGAHNTGKRKPGPCFGRPAETHNSLIFNGFQVSRQKLASLVLRRFLPPEVDVVPQALMKEIEAQLKGRIECPRTQRHGGVTGQHEENKGGRQAGQDPVANGLGDANPSRSGYHKYLDRQ